MATGKRFYWIKLKEGFLDSDMIDFLMSQKDGANYVVLYEMLCLKTVNSNGLLATRLGEILIPYDVEKIQRDCRYFSVDTIRVAVDLFSKLGLIYKDANGCLVINGYSDLLGSETDFAKQKQNQRQKALASGVDNVHSNVNSNVQMLSTEMSTGMSTKGMDNVHENVHTDIDIDIDIRDRDRYRERDRDTYRDTNSCCCINNNQNAHTREETDKTTTTIEQYAANNLQYMSPTAFEDLQWLRDEQGVSEEIIKYAIDEACNCGTTKRNWKFTKYLVTQWHDAGCVTVGDVKTYQEQWRNSHSSRNTANKHEVPDYTKDAEDFKNGVNPFENFEWS